MAKRKTARAADRTKQTSIFLLFFMSVLIVLFGTVFGIVSLSNNIQFPVLNTQIHGAVFGAVAAFLGIRYFLSVRRLKTEVYKQSSQFSWNNFRKQKAHY